MKFKDYLKSPEKVCKFINYLQKRNNVVISIIYNPNISMYTVFYN